MPPRLPSVRPTTRRERIHRNRELKNQDNLFRNGKGPVKFEFNEQVASVFDDMLDRSVPLYNECRNLTVSWCRRLARPQSCIYDLGCSTGTLLAQLAWALPEVSGLRLIGVDNSKPMLDKAREKLTGLPYPVDLIEADLDDDFSLDRACTVVMNYTLQFIPPEKRLTLIKKILHRNAPRFKTRSGLLKFGNREETRRTGKRPHPLEIEPNDSNVARIRVQCSRCVFQVEQLRRTRCTEIKTIVFSFF
jgi:SAM-dependent methyltransferase